MSDPSVLVATLGIVVLIGAYVALMPWARRFDRRVADRREAAGKPRSLVPPWVIAVAAVGMVVGGFLLMRTT